jgi:hypothetical protein
VRVEHLPLLGIREGRGDLACATEGILELGEKLDEAGAAFEQLRELFEAQLPR